MTPHGARVPIAWSVCTLREADAVRQRAAAEVAYHSEGSVSGDLEFPSCLDVGSTDTECVLAWVRAVWIRSRFSALRTEFSPTNSHQARVKASTPTNRIWFEFSSESELLVASERFKQFSSGDSPVRRGVGASHRRCSLSYGISVRQWMRRRCRRYARHERRASTR